MALCTSIVLLILSLLSPPCDSLLFLGWDYSLAASLAASTNMNSTNATNATNVTGRRVTQRPLLAVCPPVGGNSPQGFSHEMSNLAARIFCAVHQNTSLLLLPIELSRAHNHGHSAFLGPGDGLLDYSNFTVDGRHYPLFESRGGAPCPRIVALSIYA